MQTIPPRSAASFELLKGQRLKVIDIEGGQISDFFCFLKNDIEDYLSSGRTIDYLSRIRLGEGDKLYSSKSIVMAVIIEDKVGIHDFIYAPCSRKTFEFQHDEPHQGCEGNLIEAFALRGLNCASIPVTFNIFMNVEIKENGNLVIKDPASQSSDYIIIEAMEDLIVGLTACAAPKSNKGTLTAINFEILNPPMA